MLWLLMVLCLATAAQADVTRKHKISSQFMGAYESTTADYYTADKQATESTTRWTRGLMKTMTGGKPTDAVEIIRLDKEVVWKLDPKKERFTEQTFAQFREELQKAEQQMEEAEEEVPDTTAEDMYTWTVEDQSSAEAKTINGWNCRNAKIVATGTNKHDANDRVIITLDLWNSPDVPGESEIREFQSRYLKAIGLDATALTPGLTQAAMLYQKQFEAVIEAGKKAPGEPVLSTMEIKRNQLKGSNLGKAMQDAAANEMLGKLPFGKKKAPKEEQPEYVEKVKYRVTSELTEATQSAVDAAKFEVPASYKKKD